MSLKELRVDYLEMLEAHRAKLSELHQEIVRKIMARVNYALASAEAERPASLAELCWIAARRVEIDQDFVFVCYAARDKMRAVAALEAGLANVEAVAAETEVYFPLVYDGAETVGHAPRNPCDIAMEHQP